MNCDRIDTGLDEPVEVGTQLGLGNPFQRSPQVVHAVRDLVRVVVEIERDAVPAPIAMTCLSTSACASSCSAVFFCGVAPTEVPRVRPPSLASREMITSASSRIFSCCCRSHMSAPYEVPSTGSSCCRDRSPIRSHRIIRQQGGVHQLDGVHAGVLHVRENLRQDRRNVVVRPCRGVHPGMGADGDFGLGDGGPGRAGPMR